MKRQLLTTLVLAAALTACSQESGDFMIGADISEVPAAEARGGVYLDADGKPVIHWVDEWRI